MAVTIKSAHEIELMRESCRLLSLVFDGMEKMIKPGITTAEINQLGDRLIRDDTDNDTKPVDRWIGEEPWIFKCSSCAGS